MTERKETIKAFLIRTLADPVLIYAVIAMMSIMTHYRRTEMWIYGIVAYVSGWAIFRLFDYINKHHFIGFFAYIVLLSGFIAGTAKAIEKGSENYPISWGLWFLTPVNAMQYNKWFTLSIFLLFLIFMLSVIYYFTRVRYRLFMNFLILIIPFSVYGKENEEMEIGFIIALCVGFFIILANFRQMSDTKEAKTVDRPEMFRSAAVFTVLFALISAFVPKPPVEADRTMIETVINADALTDKFLEMLDVFRDDSDGEQFRRNMGNAPMYYATSPQPLQLKTATFTSYSFETDKWSYSEADSEYWYRDEKPFPIYYNGGVAEAVMLAAENDGEFAEKYGLTQFINADIRPVDKLNLKITSVRRGGNSAPVPAGAVSFDSCSFENTLGLTKSGIVFALDDEFRENESFEFTFVRPNFFLIGDNRSLANHIAAIEDYDEFLSDAILALPASDDTSEYYEILEENIDFYEFAKENYLDYGDSELIYNLSQELTAGLDSPYEKARALEMYFIENDYTYDLTYRKEMGENAEDFLFDTKRGVCYEYATAMTLLARAAGIPARYCEGFNMQTTYGDISSQDYIITANDAHGFPELYIKGYGWMCFEPTRTTMEIVKEREDVSSLLVKSGLIILGISAAVLILIFLMPVLTHKIFLVIVRRKSPNAAVVSVMRRIRKVYGISVSSSAHETEAAVYKKSSADISAVVMLFEKGEYGGYKLTEEEKTKAISTYIAAYEAYNEAVKAERKAKKERNKRMTV
ncbi:MAG: transglutaminase domain-containing protein [Ruminococcus sp.]|nr:transglutaminase domain-containing protein [Ruminococcus sp.]